MNIVIGICYKESRFNLVQLISFQSFFLRLYSTKNEHLLEDFPGSQVVKNPSASTGDTGSIPGLERFHMLWATKSTCSRARVLQQEKPPQ